MTDIIIGCAGWSYKDWNGTFYPKNLEPYEHLTFYSKYYSYVEINSTFYNLPSQEMVYNWSNRVPEDFRFSVKVWKEITHESDREQLDYLIEQFFSQLEPLNDKISYYLLQFPPWFKYSEKHLEYLKNIIYTLPKTNKYVIELRDNAWFEENIVNQFAFKPNIILGTSYLEDIVPYYHPNQTSYYIRLIGDRQLQTFKVVQREKKNEIDQLLKKVKQLENEPNIKEIFIIVNNHYTGFAPETANELKKQLGQPFHQFSTQKTLSDFL
jgi:uncharacterized protein YecE (DUF72 family)